MDTSLGIINPTPGIFTLRDVDSPERGRVLEMALVRDKRKVPEVVSEYQFLRLNRPIPLKFSDVKSVGLRIKGNGSFAPLRFVFRAVKSGRQYTNSDGPICFDGWHLITVSPRPWKYDEAKDGNDFEVIGFVLGSARQALDPLEMTPVCNEIQLDDVVVFPQEGKEAVMEDLQRRQAQEVMKMVDDKDL